MLRAATSFPCLTTSTRWSSSTLKSSRSNEKRLEPFAPDSSFFLKPAKSLFGTLRADEISGSPLGRADNRGGRQQAVLVVRGETPHREMAKLASPPRKGWRVKATRWDRLSEGKPSLGLGALTSGTVAEQDMSKGELSGRQVGEGKADRKGRV